MDTLQIGENVFEEDDFESLVGPSSATPNASQVLRGGSYCSIQQLSCAHQNSPDRPFVVGYTGRKFKTGNVEQFKKEIVPAIGFTGSYRGKIRGKIGRVELHKQSIALEEEEEEDIAVTRKQYHFRTQKRDESFDINPYNAHKYETSSSQALARGQSTNKILQDIALKLELKFIGRMQRHLHVRNTFALYDSRGTELCSIDDFYAALLHLGIMLPNVEFEALCNTFDDQRSGEISWVRFMNSIGAGSMKK